MQKNPPDLVVTPFRFFMRAVMDFPFLIGFMLLADAVQAGAMVWLPVTVRDLVDALRGFTPASGQDVWAAIDEPLRMFIYANLLIVFASRVSGTLLGFLAPFLRVAPRERLFKHLYHHSMDYFQSRMSGALGAKINEASVSIGYALWRLAFTIWPLLILFMVSTVMMFRTHAMLGFFLLGWCLLYALISIYMSFVRARMIEKIARERAFLTGRVVDVTTNIAAIKSFAHFDYEEDLFRKDMQGEIKTLVRFQFVREAGNWFHFIFASILIIGGMVLAIHYYEQAALSLGVLSFVFTLVLIISERGRELSSGLQEFFDYLGQMSDAVRTIMQHHVINDVPAAKPLAVSRAQISFDNVSFRYPDSETRPVFHDFNLEIPSGQKLGLIGYSGAGKTTLVNLLLRFYEAQAGKITIDGQDITQVTQVSLRQNVGVIPQDTSLFHRSLMENIRYGLLHASDEAVIEAAKKAHAHEFISQLPQGYDTMVGERGVKLSGGQRQRIAIARVILKNAPVLVLDEATSALDSESEKLIQDSFLELMKGRTVIAIAHRLSTIAHLDRLVILDKGRVVEDGTHDQLLARDGLYARLWRRQSGGFLPEFQKIAV